MNQVAYFPYPLTSKDISDFTDIKFVLLYDRNIFRSSLQVFCNLLKMFSNVHVTFRQVLDNLGKSSENHEKCYQYVYILE